MKTVNVNKVSLLLALFVMLLVPAAQALDVCGQEFLYIDGTVDPVVDIDCETGYTIAGYATVNLYAGAHISEVLGGAPGSGIFTSGGYNTINIYGGQFDTMLNTVSTDLVTVYGTDFEPIPGILAAGQTQITNTGYDTLIFTLVGTYQDGSPCVIPCYLEVEGVINLNVPQTAPEIDVLPTMSPWSFGDVQVGQSSTVMVQIFNYGTADLTVASVTLTGDAAFAITAGPAAPIVIAPNTSIGVDFQVTFAPTAAGTFSTDVTIISDDADEAVVVKTLTGAGLAVQEETPIEQIEAILTSFDDAAAIGTLQGYGPGNNPQNRIKALHNMIESASDLVNQNNVALAIEQLQAIAQKLDGQPKPQDFVVGEATAQLYADVQALIADLLAL